MFLVLYLPNTPLHSSRVLLPEYVLDFGYVIPGQTLSHTVNVTNTGSVAVSFHTNLKLLEGTGNTIHYLRHCGILSFPSYYFILLFFLWYFSINLPLNPVRNINMVYTCVYFFWKIEEHEKWKSLCKTFQKIT